MWDARQRPVVLAIVIGLAAYLSIFWSRHRAFVSDPQPPEGLRAAELSDRLDPNTADVRAIAAIPNVGDKLAESIVAYREAHAKDVPGRPVFRTATDLLRVKGIGAAKMEGMQSYFAFPKPFTTSKPAAVQ